MGETFLDFVCRASVPVFAVRRWPLLLRRAFVVLLPVSLPGWLLLCLVTLVLVGVACVLQAAAALVASVWTPASEGEGGR